MSRIQFRLLSHPQVLCHFGLSESGTEPVLCERGISGEHKSSFQWLPQCGCIMCMGWNVLVTLSVAFLKDFWSLYQLECSWLQVKEDPGNCSPWGVWQKLSRLDWTLSVYILCTQMYMTKLTDLKKNGTNDPFPMIIFTKATWALEWEHNVSTMPHVHMHWWLWENAFLEEVGTRMRVQGIYGMDSRKYKSGNVE